MDTIRIIALIMCFGSSSANFSLNSSTMSINLKKMLNDYDKDIVPLQNGTPIYVYAKAYIQDMVPYEPIAMHFSADMYIRLTWYDHRLVIDQTDNTSYIPLVRSAINKIWIPDVYFPHGKKGSLHSIPDSNTGAHLCFNGTVVHWQRINIVSFCPMNLKYYPFDIQKCTFSMESFTYPHDIVRLHWEENNPVNDGGKGDDLYMEEFNIIKYTTGSSESTFLRFGIQHRLDIKFQFYRFFIFYFLRDFFPCILIVVLSWVSFWIDFRSTPARIALGITTILTIVTMTNSIREHSPPSGLYRSLDYYLLVCNIFVFAALIEFAFVGMRVKQQQGQDDKEESQPRKIKERTMVHKLLNMKPSREVTPEINLYDYPKGNAADDNNSVSEHINVSKSKEKANKMPKNTTKKKRYNSIDTMSKIFFPTSFAFFNAVYFLYHRYNEDTVN